MCLTEVGHLHRALVGLEIDLEPRQVGSHMGYSGRLVSVVTIPSCPGFRHLTFRGPDGTGQEAVVPNSLLVFVYCPLYSGTTCSDPITRQSKETP